MLYLNRINVSPKCVSTELTRALSIETTEEKIKIAKLSFYKRLMANRFTAELYSELEANRVQESFPEEFNELTKSLQKCKHVKGEPFSKVEKAEVAIDSIILR